MSKLDNDLKTAFALLDLANFRWLNKAEWGELHSPRKNGYMQIPLNRETFAEMQAHSVFTGHWRTQARQIMKKPRLFRAEVYMYRVGSNEPLIERVTMVVPDMVETMWKAIFEAGRFIMSENKGVDWDENRCKGVIKV